MFEKAGKPGRAALIPMYNIIVITEIVGKPVGFALLAAGPTATEALQNPFVRRGDDPYAARDENAGA